MFEIVIVLFVVLLFASIVLSLRRRSAKKDSGTLDQEYHTRLQVLPERFVVFDLETTRLDPEKHEILEIGAIRVNRDGINHETFQSLVIPQKRISQKITEITGIDRQMVTENGMQLAEAFPEFRDFVGDLPLVAFNAKFDMAFLRVAEKSLGLPPIRNDVSCALELARRAWPGRKSYKLSELAKDGGLDTSKAHRALDDCKMTLTVYAAAASTVGRRR